mmetsp:Transcript_17747/g.34569  ORF Transcript_17747/g.34569 Transcript_17747/m.34569 type:complete len:357 (+) Transcript_17747:1079-2149(+)
MADNSDACASPEAAVVAAAVSAASGAQLGDSSGRASVLPAAGVLHEYVTGSCLLHQMSHGLLGGAGALISGLPLTMQAAITWLFPETFMAAHPAPPRRLRPILLSSRGILMAYPCCVTSNAHRPTSALLLMSCAAFASSLFGTPLAFSVSDSPSSPSPSLSAAAPTPSPSSESSPSAVATGPTAAFAAAAAAAFAAAGAAAACAAVSSVAAVAAGAAMAPAPSLSESSSSHMVAARFLGTTDALRVLAAAASVDAAVAAATTGESAPLSPSFTTADVVAAPSPASPPCAARAAASSLAASRLALMAAILAISLSESLEMPAAARRSPWPVRILTTILPTAFVELGVQSVPMEQRRT